MMGEKPSSWDLIRLLFIMPLPDTVSIPTTKNLPKPLSQFAAGMKTLTRYVCRMTRPRLIACSGSLATWTSAGSRDCQNLAAWGVALRRIVGR